MTCATSGRGFMATRNSLLATKPLQQLFKLIDEVLEFGQGSLDGLGALHIAAGVAQEKIIAVDAYPAIGTIFLWRTVVETDDEWIAMRAHRFSRQPPETWARQTVAKADNRWVRRARQLPEGRTYDWFTGHRTRASYSLEGGQHVVELHDMRYCWPLEGVESFWPLTVIFSSDGELLRVGRERRYRRGPFSSWVARTWADIWNP